MNDWECIFCTAINQPDKTNCWKCSKTRADSDALANTRAKSLSDGQAAEMNRAIKSVWINARFQKKGHWEEYEEQTGETKSGLFGQKTVTIKKQRWVELNEYVEGRIDGAQLSRDTDRVLNQLASDGFDVLDITPVVSGHYSWTGGAAGTIASWGYSVTEGVMVSAKRR